MTLLETSLSACSSCADRTSSGTCSTVNGRPPDLLEDAYDGERAEGSGRSSRTLPLASRLSTQRAANSATSRNEIQLMGLRPDP